MTTIPLQAGDRVFITVTSVECSGNPETVKVYGAIAGVVASGSCAGGLVGQQVTMGPAVAAGAISFTATHQEFGEGPEGDVVGSDRSYEVGMNDGYGDTDFNDVVISVRVLCAATNDSILDHPDFRSRYDSLMKVSNVTDTIRVNRKEWGMFMHRDPSAPNGVRLDWPSVTSNATCYISWDAQGPFPSDTLGTIHDHLWREGEPDPCGMDEKTRNIPWNPRINGGGSDFDWELPGSVHYVFTQEWVFKLPKGVPRGPQRRRNPFQWKKSANGCFSLAPPPIS